MLSKICSLHHPAAPGRTDISMWGGCGGWVVLPTCWSLKGPKVETDPPRRGQHVAHYSQLNPTLVGPFQGSTGWVQAAGEAPSHPLPRVLLGAKTCWTLTNVYTCTRTKRSVCTQHRRVFFDVRAVFKMSLGSRMAASAMAAVQQGASEARSYRQTHP